MEFKTIILLIIGVAVGIWVISGFGLMLWGLLKEAIDLPYHIKEWRRKKNNKRIEEWFKKHPDAKWHFDPKTKGFVIMETKEYMRVQKHMSGMTISEYYQDKVKQISIKHKTTFIWFAGKEEKEGQLTRKKAEAADFYLKCPNEECTEGYIDLRCDVDDVVRKQLTSAHGVTTCCGKTAPDHPHQSCDVRVEYWIEVQYTQS